MNARPNPSETAPSNAPAIYDAGCAAADAAERARALIDRRLSVLGELAEIGLDVARAIGRLAARAAGEPDEPLVGAGSNEAGIKGDFALAYARVSRAVRLTISLQSALIRDLHTLDAAADPIDEAFERREGRKLAVESIVDRVIDAEHDGREADRLSLEVIERLDDETLYRDLLSKPISEIVALICRDLGLSPDWPRLAEEA